jgi:hypothetical protein
MSDIRSMEHPVWARSKRDKYHFIKMLALTLVVISFACWTLAGAVPHVKPFDKPLQFTENGTFQISIFEDLHFGEGMSSLTTIKT